MEKNAVGKVVCSAHLLHMKEGGAILHQQETDEMCSDQLISESRKNGSVAAFLGGILFVSVSAVNQAEKNKAASLEESVDERPQCYKSCWRVVEGHCTINNQAKYGKGAWATERGRAAESAQALTHESCSTRVWRPAWRRRAPHACPTRGTARTACPARCTATRAAPS